MNSSESRQIYIPVLIIFCVVVLDQITKYWVLNSLEPGQQVEVIGRFFMFTLVYNKGGALGTNFGSSTYYLISSSLILLFVLYYTYSHRTNFYLSIPLSMIAGGAIGNLIDRLAYGKVVDFIDVDFFDIDLFGYSLHRWWTFNIADSAISVSIVFLLYVILFKKIPDSKAKIDHT